MLCLESRQAAPATVWKITVKHVDAQYYKTPSSRQRATSGFITVLAKKRGSETLGSTPFKIDKNRVSTLKTGLFASIFNHAGIHYFLD
jgi:hypothetical protein